MTRAKSKTRYERPRKKSTSDTPQEVTKSEVEQRILRPSVGLIIAVVLTAILEVLDITIVSVSIPHMLGSFGATSDQITWVLTSYLVAAAVGMPLTGYLSERLGRRRLLTISILGFVISSGLCGLSWNLLSMVLFRIAQGVSGAPLVALSQAILLDAFPREKHGQALAIFGLGIMVAPVLGPVLGGWLTDTFVWRAVFYINIPIGLIALLLSLGELPRAPVKYLKTDWTGMALLVLTVGSLQLVLDQGPTRDWFDSRFIQIFSGIAFFSGAAFLMRGWDNPRNIVDLRLLKDRNFASGLLASTAYGVPLFGTIARLGVAKSNRERDFTRDCRWCFDASYRFTLPSWCRPSSHSDRYPCDGSFVTGRRRVGTHLAWHDCGSGNGLVLCAHQRCCFRNHSRREARRSIWRYGLDA